MGHAAAERLAEVRLQAVHALLEMEPALADVLQGRRRQPALLDGVLGGLALLAVDLPIDGVGETAIQIDLVRQRHPLALLVVACGDAGIGGAGQRLQPLRRQQVGVRMVLFALQRQLQALRCGRREHQLGQHAAAGAILRVGRGAAAAHAFDLAHVAHFLALATADRRHARPALAAEGDGGARAQAIPLAVVAEPQSGVGILARLQVVRRILGHERNGAAQRVGAVQRAGGTAHDFDPLEGVDVDEIAVGIGEAADREGIRHGDAVGLDAHPVAAEAADADVADAEAAIGLADGDSGFVAEQVLEVADQVLVHLRAVDLVDGGGHVGDGAFGAGGDHDHAIEVAGVVGAAVRMGRGCGLGVGGDGECGEQRQGKRMGTHASLGNGVVRGLACVRHAGWLGRRRGWRRYCGITW